ncbi:alpha-N-arabinofuranosidase [Solimonas sp. C16B3]|uniref:non-reducing end alpha-L-arabinofuranosidase n=2 Tax=Solimonas marina TaxID=2714601 RepID=A0A969WB24_9GAMM|nr:alpha-N-arabinofuranosidase [Solimonas marina]
MVRVDGRGVIAALVAVLCVVVAPVAAAERATLSVRVDEPQWVINRNIYGQFAEHLGHGIYGGLWVGEHSTIPNVRGIRKDVVAALRQLQIPVLRWPGGCFADEYHWRDGIGPRDQRPVRVNSNWGGVTERNAFGTHEFMDLVEQLGTQAYVSVNVGSGTPQEARDWIEYMTSDSQSTLANERRKNGRDRPWKVAYIGVGNESWGCGGEMRPEYYADLYRRYSSFIRLADKHAKRYASGANSSNYDWTEVLMREAGKLMDGISLHYYSIPNGRWHGKGAATGFGEDQWASTLKNTLKMKTMLDRHIAIMDRYDPDKRVDFAVDEWGTWYDPEPGTNPAFLYQQNSLRDAIVAGVNLNLFQAHGDRVRMANIAQMVNVLQAMVLTDGPKMLRTPTYWVFEMYKVHQDAHALPIRLDTPDYHYGDVDIPAVSASASIDAQGRVHLSLVNLDPKRSIRIATTLSGSHATQVSGRVLTAPQMDAHNTFDAPDQVHPVAFDGAALKGQSLSVQLPAKSVVVLELR